MRGDGYLELPLYIADYFQCLVSRRPACAIGAGHEIGIALHQTFYVPIQALLSLLSTRRKKLTGQCQLVLLENF